MDLIEATQQTCSGEPLLSLWLLSGVVPELRGELQDVAVGPAWQERQDVAQVSPSHVEYFSLRYLQHEETLRFEPEPAVGAEVTATLKRDEEALIARAHQIVEALGERYPAFRGETFLGIQQFTDIDQVRAMEIAKGRWKMGQDPSYFASKNREHHRSSAI
ncbi:MAG TPA: hypothetical protein VMF89_02610 [Polyangiales bacterium]|nr:hypothetical protein [Polyangiales bacterium]